MTTETLEIVTRIDGSVGRVTLNRPKAINALTHGMVTELHNVLTAWADDPTITAVVLDGAGERGLCAGGDIVAIYHDAREEVPKPGASGSTSTGSTPSSPHTPSPSYR